MPFYEKNGLRYFSFENFPKTITQAIFTRRGGVSPEPWTSLNVGGSVGDERARVAENRVRSFQVMGRNPASIHDVWLVHGTDVVYADAPRPLEQPSAKADILLTNKLDVSLFMRFGDCTPIFFYDPVKQVIGMAHAGWMGTVRNVAGAAITAMQQRYDSNPADILAAIGPAIGPDHYEVGLNVITEVRSAFGEDAERVLVPINSGTHFDLWTANQIQLENAGVKKVELSGICTACHLDDWFSHRAEKGKTGRFGALMAL